MIPNLHTSQTKSPRRSTLFEAHPEVKQDLPIPITGVMRLIALMRSDITQVGTLKKREQRLALVVWCALHGVREYKTLRASLPGDHMDKLKSPALHPPEAGREGISELMIGLWLLRDDLQNAFTLDTPQSRAGYLSWFIDYHEADLPQFSALAPWQVSYLNATNTVYPLLRVLKDQGYAVEPLLTMPQDIPVPITPIMLSIWLRRTDIQQTCNLETRQGRIVFATWCLLFGRQEFPVLRADLSENYIQQLRAPAQNPDYARAGISEIMLGIWTIRGDVQQAFPLDTEASRRAFVNWYVFDCEYAIPELYEPADWQKTFWPASQRHSVSNQTNVAHTPHQTAQSKLLPGVNLIGFAYGELGIGEDVRMAALACEAAGIPFSVYNISPGINVSQQDQRVADHVQENLPYDTNIFCLTGFDTTRVFLEQGSQLFEGRYNIGFWPWELPRWPDEWLDAYQLVDEVWGSTAYTTASYKTNASIPVLHMPMVVSLSAVGSYSRADFKLPDDAFLFVFAFDFNSYLARKNPEAPVKAFKQAFPRGDEKVGLVIKVMHVDHKSRLWKRFEKLLAGDARIIIIEESMRRDKVNALYNVCDCFVSLHRAEGFGRGLAEAMLLGKPVIATDFSGNLDFTHQDNAFLVTQKPVKLAKNDYPWGKGQYWAEPDISDAAAQMQQVFSALPTLSDKILAGKETVRTCYNPVTVGNLYKDRLHIIHQSRAST